MEQNKYRHICMLRRTPAPETCRVMVGEQESCRHLRQIMIDENCAYYNSGCCTKGLPDTPCDVQGCVAHSPKYAEVINVKILHLPVKAKWYNMQDSGEKTEEYREIKPYWCKRLLGLDTPLFSHRNNYETCNVNGYTHVLLRYGYTERCIIRRIDSITIGRGYPEWGAPADRDVFIIRHHKEESPIIKGKGL